MKIEISVISISGLSCFSLVKIGVFFGEAGCINMHSSDRSVFNRRIESEVKKQSSDLIWGNIRSW